MKRFALGLLAVLVLASTADAAARYSGRVVSLDPATNTLRLEELTASNGPETAVVERMLRLAPSTRIHLVKRAATLDDAHWPVAWQAEPLAPTAVNAGDFVTVTADGETAVALEVVRPGE